MADLEVTLPDGRNASAWTGGAATGPAVLFFHGCPDSRRAAVSGDAAARAAGVRLLAVSRPGYSRTDVPGPVHERSHLDVADDALAVADACGLDTFAVLGMSVGGPYALATAARDPERVLAAGVVAAPAEVPSLDPPVHRDGLTDDEAMFFARLAATDPVTALESMRVDFEQWVARVDPADGNDAALAGRWLGILPDADRARVEPAGATELAAAAREAVGRSEGYLRDAAISFRAWPFDVADVQVPVHAWYGSDDPSYSTRNGTWLVDHAGADLVIHQGATHLAMLVDHWQDMLVTLTRRSAGS